MQLFSLCSIQQNVRVVPSLHWTVYRSIWSQKTDKDETKLLKFFYSLPIIIKIYYKKQGYDLPFFRKYHFKWNYWVTIAGLVQEGMWQRILRQFQQRNYHNSFSLSVSLTVFGRDYKTESMFDFLTTIVLHQYSMLSFACDMNLVELYLKWINFKNFIEWFSSGNIIRVDGNSALCIMFMWKSCLRLE